MEEDCDDEEMQMEQLDRQELLPIKKLTPNATHQNSPSCGVSQALMSEGHMLSMLSQAAERIRQFGSEQAVDDCTDEQLMSYLHTVLLDPKKKCSWQPYYTCCSLASLLQAVWSDREIQSCARLGHQWYQSRLGFSI